MASAPSTPAPQTPGVSTPTANECLPTRDVNPRQVRRRKLERKRQQLKAADKAERAKRREAQRSRQRKRKRATGSRVQSAKKKREVEDTLPSLSSTSLSSPSSGGAPATKTAKAAAAAAAASSPLSLPAPTHGDKERRNAKLAADKNIDDEPDISTDTSSTSLSMLSSSSSSSSSGDAFPELRGEYKVYEEIGSGTFSRVFRGKRRSDELPVALKRVTRLSSSRRVLNEIAALDIAGGKNNVMGMVNFHRERDQMTIVLPLFDHQHFKHYFYRMQLPDVQRYMHALLTGLAHLHAHGIIHRDIKPSNFLHHFDNPERGYRIVDFGLAQLERGTVQGRLQTLEESAASSASQQRSRRRRRKKAKQRKVSKEPSPMSGPDAMEVDEEFPQAPSTTQAQQAAVASSASALETPVASLRARRASLAAPLSRRTQLASRRPRKRKAWTELPPVERGGTRGFRAPEILLRCSVQTTAIDVWSAGVVLLCILARRYPFFQSNDDFDALFEIGACVGFEKVNLAAQRYPEPRTMRVENVVDKPRTWREVLTEAQSPPWPSNAYDLLDRLLDLDPRTRITAADALKHEFFASMPE